MKKILLFVTTLFFVSYYGVSAQSIRHMLVEMPDSLLPLLTKNNREDCFDFLDANMRARVTNRFDSKSELYSYTSDFLYLQTSDAGSMQMKLLPKANDTIVCVVNTVCAEACDSRIAFYNRRWEPLTTKRYFDAPEIWEFFSPADSAELLKMTDIYLVKLSLSATSDSLYAEYTIPQYMLREETNSLSGKLHRIVFLWNEAKGCFVKTEDDN